MATVRCTQAEDDLPHDNAARNDYRRLVRLGRSGEKSKCSRRRSLPLKKTARRRKSGGYRRPGKSSRAKSSKLAGQLAPANMIAMIEQHAGATCASGHHQDCGRVMLGMEALLQIETGAVEDKARG